jgi:hypothetical protein
VIGKETLLLVVFEAVKVSASFGVATLTFLCFSSFFLFWGAER